MSEADVPFLQGITDPPRLSYPAMIHTDGSTTFISWAFIGDNFEMSNALPIQVAMAVALLKMMAPPGERWSLMLGCFRTTENIASYDKTRSMIATLLKPALQSGCRQPTLKRVWTAVT